MKRFLYILLLTAITFAAGCSDYDDSQLSGRIDGFKERIAKLQGRIASLNSQLADLSELTSGNVITAMAQDSEGNYVITYKDNKNEEKSVVLATTDQMLNVPLLGVELDAESGLYYWTVTVDGETSPLSGNDGERVPVSGHTPVVSVDAQGFWTVNGERLNDASGRPIEANDGESCLFKSIERDANGNLSLTLGNGEVVTLPIQQVLNLTLSTAINTTVVDISAPMTVKYTLHGEHAADALVGIAAAEGLEAALDKQEQQIAVTFPAGFREGHLIVVAYDMLEHTVLRPVFFTKATSDRIEIGTAAELVQFAADVNAGTGAQLMTAVLTGDIDMTDIASWTPIGNGTFAATTAVSTPSGAVFEGTFDGQGHALRNFRMAATLTGDNQTYGLFGILKGATVRNLVLGAETGDTGSFTVSGNGVTSTGVIAGASIESTIEECTSYLPMECLGNGTSGKLMTMGLVGFVYGAGTSEETVTQLIGLKNYGALKAVPGAANANGFTSTQVGCIAGLSNTSRTSTFQNKITRCVNYGDMETSTGRASGIVAAANTFTVVSECDNHGDMLNTYAESGGGRLGNITCILGTASKVDGCTNYGDVVATNAKTHAGGLVCLTNSADSEVLNSANYGNVITDLATYRGTLVANINNGAKLDNNTAGGGVGSYNGGNYVMADIDETNFMDYIGLIKTGNESKVTNTKYGGDISSAKGIRTADDLVAFAAAVNAGTSIEEWQNEDGEVCLLTNIDMAAVTEWTPIGKAAFTWGSNKLALTGTPFAGHFNGQGYRIRNLRMVAAGSEEGQAYGFFGALAPGAVVENFSFDSGCSLTVTASARCAAGLVAGVVYDATVRDITGSAPMLFQGAAGASVPMYMGLIGFAFAETAGVVIDSVNNNGEITAENRTPNLEAGGNACHAAGIVAFATNEASSQQKVIISDCINYGAMTSALARTSGIVAAANRYTQLTNCVNHGDQLNTFPKQGGGRQGQITCITGTGSSMIGCTNYGDLTSTTGGRTAGIVSLSNTATFENCANYGTILSDDANRGVFWAYNNGAAAWTNCTAGGKVGTYNNGTPVFDSYSEADQANYLGKQGATKSTLTNIVYQLGNSGGGDPGGEAQLRILFIGNSFTKDAVEHLPGLLKAAGIDKVKMTHMYYGGRTVPEYNNGFATVSDYRCYECAPGAAGWTELMNKTIKEVAASDEWDIVTIQEHTGKVNAWSWTPTEKEALQGLINNVKSTQTGAMPKFCYILSQAYGDPAIFSYSQQTVIVNNFASSQADMYAAIVAQGKKVMAEVTFDDLIATGTVLQNLRSSKLQNAMDMTRDGYHMDYGIARYAASCAVFEKLISPAFDGVTLDGNPFRYTISNTTAGSYSTPVTDANAPLALQAARYALATPYAVTDMSDIDQEKPDNGIEDTEFDDDKNKE